MNKILLSGGCSFTFGNELSDDNGKDPSCNSWSAILARDVKAEYICLAKGGIGNPAIARRIFSYISSNPGKDVFVTAMWSFLSRYDWAMPRHKALEGTRWATITPWDTADNQAEVQKTLANSEPQLEEWKRRRDDVKSTGVGPFADAIYRYAANEYHEAYLSWKSIVWLQNILEKKKIPYMFTLADNSLFWRELEPLSKLDPLLNGLYNEIDFNKWVVFGERQMGFNQWSLLNDYPRATTHPLDPAHVDAAGLMKDKFLKLYNQQ
jgi:hypothetical protein